MKTKIYKVLSVVLAIAMLLSTCISAITTVSASAAVVPTMVNGTIDGNSGTVSYQPHRIYTEKLLAVADYESLTIGTGYKAYYHFYDSEGTWKNSSGTWINPGTYNVATMTGISSGATHFRVTIALTENGDLSPDLPEGAFALVPVPVEPKTATYFVSAAGSDENDGLEEETAVTSVVKAVELAVAANYSAADTITVKVLGETVNLERPYEEEVEGVPKTKYANYPVYPFNLVVESATEGVKTAITFHGGANLSNNEGAKTTYKNVALNNSATWQNAYLASSNVAFEDGATVTSGFLTVSYGTGNDGGAAKTIAGQSVEFNCATPYAIILANGSWSGRTYSEDVNLVVNNADSNPFIGFNSYYSSAKSGSTKYKKNININLKSAKGVRLYQLDGTTFEGAIQIIDSANLGFDTVYESTVTSAADPSMNDALAGVTAAGGIFKLSNKTGNADILSFTDTAGKYAVDTARYTVTATPVAGGEAIVAKDGFLEVTAGEYNITATKNVETVTYTAQTGAEIATVAAAVEKAIADGYMAKDTVIVKVAGESVELGTLPAYPFDLVVESAVPETKTTILCGTSTIVLANNEGATTSYKNVTFSNSDTQWKSAISNSSNISFDEKVTFSFGYGTSICFGTGNDGGANKYIAGQSLYLASANLPYRVNLANSSWSGRKYTEDVNITVDNAAISPIFQLNSYYSSQASGTTQYQKNLNFILKSAKGIGFEYLDGVTYGTGIQIINNAGITIGETTTGFASLPADKTWVINNNTEDKELITVTETAGKFAVNADEGAVVKATPVAGGDAIEAIDGYLTLPAGQYNIGAKLPAKRTDNYVDHIAYRTALNGNNALNNVAAKWNKGEDINVVYYGGSVTNGSGASDADNTSWRGIISNWLTENAPEGTTVTNINSAIGGTGTQFGIYRLKEAVLDKQPDLLFIEFSINDWYDDQVSPCDKKEAAKRFETIIREVRKALPNCDIVNVLTTEKACIGSLKNNKLHAQAQGHDEIAREYGIPTLYVGKALAHHLPAEWESVWGEYMTDIVHPTDKGYEVYANVVKEYISNSLLFDNAEATEIKAHVMPEIIVSKELYDGNLQVEELNQDIIDASVELGGDEFTLVQSSVYKNFETHVKLVNGNKIAYEFTGTELGIIANTNSYEDKAKGEKIEAYTYAVVIKDKESGEEVLNTTVKLNSINPGIIVSGLEKGTYIAELTAVFTSNTAEPAYAKIGAFTTRDETQKTVQVLPEGKEYTYYVSAGGSDNNDGLSADTAVTSLEKAIEVAKSTSRKYATDTVTIKVVGTTAVAWGKYADGRVYLPDHDFKLVVTSDTSGATIGDNLGGVVFGGDTDFENITVWVSTYPSYRTMAFNDHFVNFASNTTIKSLNVASIVIGQPSGTGVINTPLVYNINTGIKYLRLSNDYSQKTFNADVTLNLNDTRAPGVADSPVIYLGTMDVATIYNANVNINIIDAPAFKLTPGNKTPVFGENAALQIINSAGVTIDDSTNIINGAAAGKAYVLNNKSGNAGLLSYTETTGKFAVNVDLLVYEVIATSVADENVQYKAADGYLTVPAGEYIIDTVKKPAYKTYFVETDATGENDTYATVKDAIDAAIAEGYVKGDEVTIKVKGESVSFGGAPAAYTFDLIVESADSAVKTKIIIPGGQTIANNEGRTTTYKNVEITNEGKQWTGVYLNSSNIVFDKDVKLNFGYGTYVLFGSGNDGGAAKSIAGQNMILASNAPYAINFSNMNWSKRTYTEDVNVTVDNAQIAPQFFFNAYYSGSANGTTKFEKKLNIVLENAKGATFGQISGVTFVEGFQILNKNNSFVIDEYTAGVVDLPTENTWIINNKTDNKEIVSLTETAGKFAVTAVPGGYEYVAFTDAEGNVTKVTEVGEVTLPAGIYTVEITRDPLDDVYYVEAGADGSANTYATVADAITALNAKGYIAKDKVTLKLKGEAVEMGAIPAYEYTLVVESDDAAVKTKLTFDGSTTIANNLTNTTTFKNVEFNNGGVKWKTIALASSSVVIDADCVFNLGEGTIFVCGDFTDANGARTIAGQTVQIDCALPYAIYLSSSTYSSRTYTDQVNLILNGTGTAKIMFNAEYLGEEKGTVTYNELVNIYINAASALELSTMNNASFDKGLQIFNNANIEINEETLPGMIVEGYELPEETWIINNATGRDLIAPDAEYAGIYEVIVDTAITDVYMTDAEGTEYVVDEGYIYVDEVPGIYTLHVECKNHDMQPATCDEPSKCSRCDYTEGEALGHSFGEYKYDEGSATCTEDGTKTAKCDNCDETHTVTAEDTALGHSFTNYIDNEDAECEKDATETATCDRCEETDTRDQVGTALGHDMQPASCTEASKCSRCDHTEGEALGHNFGEYKYDEGSAKCGVDGTETAECDRCDATDTRTAVGTALEHKYENHVYNNDATCTKDGTKTATCSNGCGTKETITAVGTKLPHKNVTVLGSKATLTANGSLVTKCSVCGTPAGNATPIAKIASVTTTAKITYNGKTKTPAVTVKDANGKVIGASNYDVTYAKGRKNYGKYKITVTFKGNYSGSKVIYFEIVPKNSKVSKLTAAKKSLKVKLSRQKKATGYQIQYSTSKTFKSAKTVTLKKNSITSKTIKKLKAKKTYYVRVRTYKQYKGKKYYSAWSAAKKKKTK